MIFFLLTNEKFLLELLSEKSGFQSGSLGIAPTRNCTHFFKIRFVVTGGGFYSYYINQGNKSDKDSKIVRKKLGFIHTKRFYTFLKRWGQFRLVAIPRLPFNPQTCLCI